MSQKIKVLPTNEHNSIENAYIEDIDVSELSSRNARRKYTKRRYWIERNRSGARLMSQTWDDRRQKWCNPNKSTYDALKYCTIINDEFKTITIGKYGYKLQERVKELFERYEFQPDQEKAIKVLADYKEKINNAYSNAIENAKKDHEENKKELSDFKINTFYSEKEIKYSKDDIELLKVFVTGRGVKKRCRKSDFIHDKLCFFIPSPDATNESILETLKGYKSEALNHLEKKYRSIERINLCAKKCTFQAAKGDSPFYGMKEMLMDNPVAALELEHDLQ